MRRIRNTWELANVSWGVLRKDRELLLLPILSMLVSAAVVTVVVVVGVATGAAGQAADGSPQIAPLGWLLALLAVFGVGIVTVFFNGALVAGAYERMAGGDPTVRGSIHWAFTCISGLVPWALLNSTVGMLLALLRGRGGWLRRLVARIVEVAWDVATFLAVPGIVIDRLGPIEALKRSSALLRQTWGENLTARVGFGLLAVLLSIPGFLFVSVVSSAGVNALTVFGVIVMFLWFLTVAVVMAALYTVFQTALYLYATTGDAPSGFDRPTLDQAVVQQ